MPSFYPETTIYACSTGIDDYNKPYFESNSAAASYCMGRAKLFFSDYSYQRADERQYCAVYANFNELEECDTLIWQNADFSGFWFIANITNLEWKNPNCVWIWFKVDAYMTFCGNIDWSSSYCLVEREHVQNDWNGANPNFNVMGTTEGLGIGPELDWGAEDHFYTPNMIVITSPYDQSGSPNSGGTMQNGVYTGLNSYTFSSASAANSYLQAIQDNPEANIENVVSIQTVPSEFINGQSQQISAPSAPWLSYTDIYNAKCWSGEFCQLRIASLTGSDAYFAPEYFDVPGSYFFWEKDTFAGGVGGIFLTPNNYMGSSLRYHAGFAMNDYPSGVAVGNTYAQWINTNGAYLIGNTMVNTLGSIANIGINASLGGGLLNSVLKGENPIVNDVVSIGTDVLGTISQFAQAKQNGTAMLGSMNTNANIAVGVGAYGYTISWVIPFISNRYALDDFFSRYGYKVMQLKVPNRNTRPHWNFVKCSEAHVQGDMPYRYRVMIESMLNKGVTFWNEGTTIGDYSDKAGNRG